jgi:hypothetical protein
MVESGTRTFTAGAAIAQYLRVKLSAGVLAVAGADEADIGVMDRPAFAANDSVAVRLPHAPGTVNMVASEAISQYSNVYGAAGGKVADTTSTQFIGVALTAAGGDGSIIEVLRFVPQAVTNFDDFDGPVVIDEDFVGDWAAAGTALGGEGRYAWTKTETNGLGVISSDEPNGVAKFSFDAVAEAATATLYMVNSPFDVDQSPVAEFRLGIFDIGDDAALDIDFGFAADAHATNFESANIYAAFHLNGNSLALTVHSDDGVTDTAETSTSITLVDDEYNVFKVDATDKADVKFYVNGVRVAAGTTFTLTTHTGGLTPIVMVEKTSNDTTADVRVDRIRAYANRN